MKAIIWSYSIFFDTKFRNSLDHIESSSCHALKMRLSAICRAQLTYNGGQLISMESTIRRILTFTLRIDFCILRVASTWVIIGPVWSYQPSLERRQKVYSSGCLLSADFCPTQRP